MKSTLILLFGALICLPCSAADTPRYKNTVICFNGGLDSGSSCSKTSFRPDELHWPATMRCGFAGKVSEIEWSFVERHGDKDVYQFTRRFPADTDHATTTSKNVEFSDQRVIVFQDTNQVVVIQPPKKKP